MTPADGSDFHPEAGTARVLPASRAILLHGGRALLLIEDSDAPLPLTGHLLQDDRRSLWTAECWPVGQGEAARWHGVAVLDEVPGEGAEIVGAASGGRWRVEGPLRIDVAPEPLAELVLRAGADCRGVFSFLTKHLMAGRVRESAEARAYRSFTRGFIDAAAERDGFVELVASPDTGGFFAQGWSMSLPTGAMIVADAADDLTLREVEVAHFERDDLLPPGKGFCFFGKAWREQAPAAVDAVFFEAAGKLRRLDVVEGTPQLGGEFATAHVARMLPRLIGSDVTLAAFRRVCRPRFAGTDTLSGTALPIAAALDTLVQAPDGTMLAIGWMLDPLHQVERVLVKSTANHYGRLDSGWCALPRPDLIRGFGQDPRFADLLDPSEEMHGFVAHLPARREQVAGAEVYLELVLRDGGALFRPLNVTPFESTGLVPNILHVFSPTEPELPRIVADHLAPFLASVGAAARRPSRRNAARPIELGGSGAAREAVAVIPFRSTAQIQPLLALLAGMPEAAELDLALVAPRAVAAGMTERLGDAFDFFGLRGCLALAAESDSLSAQLDIGVAASSAPSVLCWLPSVLPMGGGWLQPLLDEAAALPRPGLLSPALIYEDGSIAFGGGPARAVAACGLSGYDATWLRRGAPRPAATGAKPIALVDRAALADAGGFAGSLFSDALAHVDLADRLRRQGMETWCSGRVEFWCLEDEATEAASPADRIIRQIDAALLERRAGIALREAAA